MLDAGKKYNLATKGKNEAVHKMSKPWQWSLVALCSGLVQDAKDRDWRPSSDAHKKALAYRTQFCIESISDDPQPLRFV